MLAPDDTIVAVATPPGRGGLGIVRLSGSDAVRIAEGLLASRTPLRPRVATFATLSGPLNGPPIARDEVVATWFRRPASYTGEDVVEISAHGSPVVLQSIVRRAIDAGARLARPGEFTLRAFLHGKRDLVQSEAVADLIEAATPVQAAAACDQLTGALTGRIAAIDEALFDLIARLEASLDFPDEGYHFVEPDRVVDEVRVLVDRIDALLADAERGRMIREGATVVIAGRTNVGKSSVFNALAGAERAIVTDVPGTTRDLITERVDIDGVCVTLVDTAGDRETDDRVEREGLARGGRARAVADLVLVVLDRSSALTADDETVLSQTSGTRRLVVLNKSDCDATIHSVGDSADAVIAVSATRGDGIPALRAAIAAALCGGDPSRDPVLISNTRHVTLLREARASLHNALQAAGAAHVPEEFLLQDLQGARMALDEVRGIRTSEDILRHIFERFCIGK